MGGTRLAAAFVVFAGTTWVTLDANGLAIVDLCFVAVWLLLAVALVRHNRRLSEPAAGERARAGSAA